MENKDNLYAKWLNGELSDDEFRAIEGEEALAELKRITQTVDQWSMPKYDTAAGYEKLKKTLPLEKTKTRSLNRYWLMGIAASFLVFVAAWFVLSNNQQEVLFAEHGQTVKSELIDGSQVVLNDGSKISYKTKNWAEQRSIELQGEALFEVTKGSPFIVHTSNGDIRVLGTQFNVKAWGDILYVECYEGKVQVSVDDQATILTAQEAVRVEQGKMQGKQAITNEAPLWQKKVSRFYDEPLQDVFAELERQYNIKVNSSIQNRNFSGTFEHDDLESALRSICLPLGLGFSIDKDRMVVNVQ